MEVSVWIVENMDRFLMITCNCFGVACAVWLRNLCEVLDLDSETVQKIGSWRLCVILFSKLSKIFAERLDFSFLLELFGFL